MKKITFLLILLLIPITTQASGMAVFPDHLNLSASEFSTLSISNPSQDVLLFEVYADEFKDLIEITPRSFTLESGAQKKVRVGLTPPLDPSSTADRLVPYLDTGSADYGASKGGRREENLNNERQERTILNKTTNKYQTGEILSTHLSITASALTQTDANVAIGTKIPLTLHLDSPPAPNIFKTLLYTLLFVLVIFCLRFWYKIFSLFKKLSH